MSLFQTITTMFEVGAIGRMTAPQSFVDATSPGLSESVHINAGSASNNSTKKGMFSTLGDFFMPNNNKKPSQAPQSPTHSGPRKPNSRTPTPAPAPSSSTKSSSSPSPAAAPSTTSTTSTTSSTTTPTSPSKPSSPTPSPSASQPSTGRAYTATLQLMSDCD